MLVLVLGIAAMILFVLAAVNVHSPRANLVAAGLACLTLAWLLSAYKGLLHA